MKKINIPFVLLILFFLLIVLIFVTSRDNSIQYLVYSGLSFSPISILILLINKLLNKNSENRYFVPVLIINILLIIVASYFYYFALGNFMNFG
jgi:hypothetical protein